MRLRAAALFEPGQIGPVRVANRVVMASMTTRGADAEGFVTAQTVAYFAARARGGVGLVTVEMAAPERAGRHRRHELGLYDDRFLPGLASLVEAIHSCGAKASIQIGHGGGHTRVDICGETPIAPSAVPHVVQEVTTETVLPEEMSAARIEQTIAAHVAAARRARAAGFDCVEIHASHGYLISQYHTPFENRRNDAWGGSLENRARLGIEITRRVKAAAPELGLIYRLTVDDFFPEGLQLPEGLQIAEWAAAAGADAIHVSAGHYRSLPSSLGMIPPMSRPDACFLHFARAVRARVFVPVIAVGRLGDPDIAAAALANGDCDFVALGRPLLADESWVARVAAGLPVRHCLACNTCVNDMRNGSAVRCLVNGRTGREHEFETGAARQVRGRRIAVIGAGPAGLTYAALAAEQNQVALFERRLEAGGALRQAALAPVFQAVESAPRSFERYIAGLVRACAAAGVKTHLGVDAWDARESLRGYDLIVIATGARYRGGLGLPASALLRLGAARWPGLKSLFARAGVRDWLYYRARRGTGAEMAAIAHPGQEVIVIGDAATPGKSQAAIAQAFEAALLGPPSTPS